MKWEDPPGFDNGKYSWTEEAEELRKNPGRWGMISEKETPSQASSMAGSIRSGRIRAFTGGRWEASARKKKVYVRFLGA